MAALAVAMAAALLAMVCRVTLRRQPGAPAQVAETVEAAERLRATATSLSVEDGAAYEGVLRARRRGSAGESRALAEALKRATDVPQATARAGRDVLAACAAVLTHVRASTLSDLDVAATLAWAALEAGAGTARSNLADVTDEEYLGTAWRTLARLIDEGATLRRRLADGIEERRRTT